MHGHSFEIGTAHASAKDQALPCGGFTKLCGVSIFRKHLPGDGRVCLVRNYHSDPAALDADFDAIDEANFEDTAGSLKAMVTENHASLSEVLKTR